MAKWYWFLLMVIGLAACGGEKGSSNSPKPPDRVQGDTPPAQIGILVPGDPATLVAAVMPDYAGPRVVTDAEISTNPDTGARIVRTAIYVLFQPTATVAEVNALLTSINGRILASLAGSLTVSVAIPDPGSLSALYGLIETIKNNSAVDEVLADSIPEPEALPLEPFSANTDSYIDHHLAVRGAAAWNARRAITYSESKPPSFMIYDFFGSGAPSSPENQVDWQLINDANGDVVSGFYDNSMKPEYHGYHVTGIAIGKFGDSGLGGEVTGMFPSGDLPIQKLLKGYAIDAAIVRSGEMVAMARLLRNKTQGNVVLNTSMSTSLKCNPYVDESLATTEAKIWLGLIRQSPDITPLEDRYFHADAAANNSCILNRYFPDVQLAKYHAGWAAAALLPESILGQPPLTNTLSVENRSVRPSVINTSIIPNTKTAASVGCTYKGLPPNGDGASYTNGSVAAIGSRVDFSIKNENGIWSYLDAHSTYAGRLGGTSMAAPQVAGLATYLWTLRPDLKSNEVAERIRKHARPVPTSVCATDTSSTPVIDAYATILSADVSLVDAPARTAILDVVGVDGVSEPDGDFTYADFKKYIDEFTSSVSSPEFAEYSRFDLNGDGYTGGSKLSYFNLNMDVKDNASVYGVVEAGDGSAKRWFDESALTDLDILCYYAYLILPTEDQADIESACMPKPEILIETGVDSAGPEFLPFYYVSTVAINDRGVVAFNGFDAKANSGGFVTSAPHIARQVGPTGTPSNNPFSIFDINSAAVADVVSVQMIYSTGDILLQRWKEDGIGQPSLISRSAFPVAVVNDNGLVAFQGFYNGKSALIAGAGIADLISLRTFDDNFFELVLDIANTGDIVYRDHTNNIVVQKYPSTSVDTLTNVAYLDIKQSPPGISGDGKLVVFAGADSAGPGIFVVERAPVRKTFKIVDTHGDPLSAGGKFTALAEINGSFGRVAISTTAQTNGETRVTVVFTGQRTISELANDVDGIFRVTGMLSADGEALTLGVPIKVLQYDDKLSNEKYVRHFDFSLSQSGEYIGIWVSFADGSQAVVRAE